MPIEYWIEKELHRVRAVVTDDFTTDEILNTLQTVSEDADYEASFDVLSDHTNIGEPLTYHQNKNLETALYGQTDENRTGN